MIRAFILMHPQSADLISGSIGKSKFVDYNTIACGTSKIEDVDFSEANDFHPTYASWNSALFETSVILTIWEHADQLIGDDFVAILHSDITPHFKINDVWKKISGWLNEEPKRAVGLTVPSAYLNLWNDWEIPKTVEFTPAADPMLTQNFDHNINVWNYIKSYDNDIYEWAFDIQPKLIYSHQFACSREVFDLLGSRLYGVAHRLRLQDIGFWTPHMFERLIALYLARSGFELRTYQNPIISTCFWHYSSSGAFGPGNLNLYGPRPRKYYKLMTRWNNNKRALAKI